MTTLEIASAFGQLPTALLKKSLTKIKSNSTGHKETLVKQIVVECIAIGVEKLVDKLEIGTRKAVSKACGVKWSGDDGIMLLENHIKANLVQFLLDISASLAKSMAHDAGIDIDQIRDKEQIKVKLFEETILLGTQGFFDLLTKPILLEYCDFLLTEDERHPTSDHKFVHIEGLMVKLFDLEPPKDVVVTPKKVATPKRGKRQRSNQEEEDGEEEEEEESDENEDDIFKPGVTAKALNKLRVVDLRQYLTGQNLTTSGRKAELVERISNHLNGKKKQKKSSSRRSKRK